jgi:hypothetical protein
MKRILATAALAVGLVAGAATSAQAATIPRVTGTYSVKTTITAHPSNPNDVGTVATKTWSFTPTCASGGCLPPWSGLATPATRPASKRFSSRSLERP